MDITFPCDRPDSGRDRAGTPLLPKGHTSILSPKFRYVPAVRTDVAETFARVRGQRLQPQPAPRALQQVAQAGDQPEYNIEVLEAAWLPKSPPCFGGRRRS